MSQTLADLQIRVDKWIHTYGVRYFSELTNMACLTEEVGELARVMARKYGDQSFKKGETHDPSEEMADVLWVLICLATQPVQTLPRPWSRVLKRRPSATPHATSTTPNWHPASSPEPPAHTTQ